MSTSRARSLVHYLKMRAEAQPHKAALHAKREGRWQSWSWRAYWQSAKRVAGALIEAGHTPGECVVIAGANHPEWVRLELGVMSAQGVPAPVYGTSTVEQAAYIATDSGAKTIAVDGVELLEKFLEGERQGLLSGVERYITFFDVEHSDPRVISLSAFEASAPDSLAEVDARVEAIDDDTVCLTIYTSGTTGKPKGVEIDHGGVLHVAYGLLAFEPRFETELEYHTVSYLPLSHQAEQLLTNVLGLVVGGESYFCPVIADVREYLGDARPTVFLGVPRVWEKFEAALRGRLAEATGLRANLAAWAMDTELACFREQIARGLKAHEHMPLRRRAARALVINKIKTALGLDRLEVAVTGSAPISPETQDFFASLGICVFEVYGLTETSGAATITDPRRPAFGTVGKCFKGIDVRIADEDEIQLRGRNMVRGYRGLPEETKALFTDDGWLRTGDAGSLDAEGNLKITGRLKELIITAGAKNVAPVELEFYLQSIVGVGQAVVVGDRKPFLGALLTLDPEGLDALADAAATAKADMATLAADPKVRAYLEREVEEKCNGRVARYQTIKKFDVLPAELSVEGGELTASMKLRRGPISDKYAERIEAF
ncbi:MAG: AMP-dependent synthetase/ligase, partial [Myxococcota bacterium]